MAKSIKLNYCLSLFDTFLGVVFPLITFPYVTRILSPDNIGLTQFYLNLIGYVILFTAFGIPLYGVRAVAKVRDNIKKRNKITAELLSLHLALTLLGYLLLLISCFTISKTKENLLLYIILSSGLLFNTVGVQWFYQAIEDFFYISIRSLCVKIVSLLLLFLLVRDKNDILLYGVVLACGSAGNYLFNFFRLSKYLTIDDFKSMDIKQHLKPAFKVYILNLTIGIYTQLSVLLLGFMQTNADVGYYSMAQKIVSVLNSIMLTLATVLLPRLSKFVGNKDINEFKVLGDKAISFVLAISLPICVGLIILAKPIVYLLFGELYESSILVLQIWAPIFIIIGLSQVYGKSILYSIGHESIMTISTLIGMLVYFAVGIPGIFYFSINGAAIGSLCAELAVTTTMIFLGRGKHPCTILKKQNITYIVSSIMMGCVVSFVAYLLKEPITKVIFGILSGIGIYTCMLAFFKDPFYLELRKVVTNLLDNHGNISPL